MTAYDDYKASEEMLVSRSDVYNSPCASVGSIGGRHGNLMLVGHGVPTNSSCGDLVGIKVCLDWEAHDKILGTSGSRWSFKIGGKIDFEGGAGGKKAYVHVVNHSCNNFACPICYRSACYREADKAEQRLKELEKKFKLKVEHIISSFAPNSPENKLLDEGVNGMKKYRKKILECLKARGWLGGVHALHGFRYNAREKTWFYGAHVHSLGVIAGGYTCRNCPKLGIASKEVCHGCGGFEEVTRKLYETDKCIVKIAEDREGQRKERVSIFSTLSYELSHATIRNDVKRATPCWYSGVCSYRKLKVIIVKKGNVCPICGGKLEWCAYVGSEHLETDPSKLEYRSNLLTDCFDSGGEPRFLKKPTESFIKRFMKHGAREGE
jgi:hypothetical protein